MEILVTIIAFWLILVGAYGAYSLTQERSRERAPKVRPTPQVNLATVPAGAGPFGPVSLPAERVPSFIARATSAAARNEVDDFDAELARGEIESDRFAAERIVAARLQARHQPEEAVIEEDEPVYEVPKPSMPRYAEPEEEAPRSGARLKRESLREIQPLPREEAPRREHTRRTAEPHLASFELPARPRPTEVDYLRAEVQHLRSEITALSYDQPAVPAGRQDRPKQRRYRTGNYTQLPRVLRRQVKEARGKFGGE
jgi:hypothetical protein